MTVFVPRTRAISLAVGCLFMVLCFSPDPGRAQDNPPTPTAGSDTTDLPTLPVEPTSTPEGLPAPRLLGPSNAPVPPYENPVRGFDENNFQVTFYDLPHLYNEIVTLTWNQPLDFSLDCFGETYPYKGCELVPDLGDGSNWSARWKGNLIVLKAGDYTFNFAQRDDGARLFIDGSLVLDAGWNYPVPDQLPGPRTIHLDGGTHQVIVDYEQRIQYLALLQLRWVGPDFEDEVIPLYAPPTVPPASLSRYWNADLLSPAGFDLEALYDDGCSQARDSHTRNRNTIVVLDFGSPTLSHGIFGVITTNGLRFHSNAEIEVAIMSYARGFWACSSPYPDSHTVVAVGVSNTGYVATPGDNARRLGIEWAKMIKSLRQWIIFGDCNNPTGACSLSSRISIAGAINIEHHKNTITHFITNPGGVEDWADGYASETSAPYYDFGTCEDCGFAGPGGADEANGDFWNRDHYWYVSWGIPNAWPLPLIYRSDGSNADQWEELSQYSATCSSPCAPAGSGFHSRLYFAGSFTQHAACASSPGGCIGVGFRTDNSPNEGWLQLYDAAYADPVTRIPLIEWSTDVTWQN